MATRRSKLAAEKIQEWTGTNKEVVYIFLGPGGNMTTDPTIKPALIDAAAADVKVLQNLGRMKEFDPTKWVDDSYVRKAYAEMKLDYDAELASTKNYEISGEDKFCKKPISDPRKAGEVWVDDEGILPFSSAMCTLGAYADYKAKGKRSTLPTSSIPPAASSCSQTRRSSPWPAATSRRSC